MTWDHNRVKYLLDINYSVGDSIFYSYSFGHYKKLTMQQMKTKITNKCRSKLMDPKKKSTQNVAVTSRTVRNFTFRLWLNKSCCCFITTSNLKVTT